MLVVFHKREGKKEGEKRDCSPGRIKKPLEKKERKKIQHENFLVERKKIKSEKRKKKKRIEEGFVIRKSKRAMSVYIICKEKL